jgi:predicted RNA-binding Zn-ribbon protein involved in translation (DUF1610 family)
MSSQMEQLREDLVRAVCPKCGITNAEPFQNAHSPRLGGESEWESVCPGCGTTYIITIHTRLPQVRSWVWSPVLGVRRVRNQGH